MHITVTYESDDVEPFNMAHNALAAWTALSEIAQQARNQLKHGDTSGDRAMLEAIQTTTNEALWRIEP